MKREYLAKLMELYDNDRDALMRDIASLVDREQEKEVSNVQKYVPPAGEKPLIVVEELSRYYKNGREKIAAVNKVSFEVFPKEIVAITGTSGSGKSTLLHMLGGLDKPTAGKIEIDGVNIAKLSDGRISQFRNKTIGFVFQFFYLQPFLSLEQNILSSPTLYP